MQIYYTDKEIMWSNENNDYLETNMFNEYFRNSWTQISNVKSINWTDHYSANFYATDRFSATYIRIDKGGKQYYFFVEDIEFDGSNGTQYTLNLDFYNTYTRHFVDIFKQRDYNVLFKRKHANRFSKDGNKVVIDLKEKHNYLTNIPDYLQKFAANKVYYEAQNFELGSDIRSLEPCFTNDQGIFAETFIPKEVTLYSRNGTYAYLKIKRPQQMDTFRDPLREFLRAEFYYIPIAKKQQAGSAGNVWEAIIGFPADYVVGVVLSPIPPSAFKYFGSVKTLFRLITVGDKAEQLFLTNTSAWCVPAAYLTYETMVYPNAIIAPEQNLENNIQNYKSEPMLYNDAFYELKLNNEIDIKVLPNYNIIYDDVGEGKLKFQAVMGGDILIRQLPETEPLTNYYIPPQFVPVNYPLPFSGSVLNSYLLNNINSINTGIATAAEQNKLSALFNVIGSISSAFNADSFAGSASSLFSGFKSILTNEFSLNAKIANLNAKIADMGNKAGTVLDSYGKGVSCFNFGIFWLSHFRVPDSIQKMIFQDIYFNGYVVNTVLPFSTYDNRRLFNYFEIENAYQYAASISTLPKRILRDVGRQFSNGIRLWKIINPSFTMESNNNELSYA